MNPPAVAAATTAVIRDRTGSGGVEVLLLKRHPRLAFHGGDWVFPGGRVDPGDRSGEGPNGDDSGAPSSMSSARRAAAREAIEECGLELSAETLVPLSHWTTPDGLPRKFATWFFIAGAPDGTAVQVDNDEIIDFGWFTPRAALDAQRSGALTLPSPTFVTLHWLLSFETVAAVLAHFESCVPPRILPRPVPHPEGRVSLLPGDSGYESGDLFAEGPRHRSWFLRSGWRYERKP